MDVKARKTSEITAAAVAVFSKYGFVRATMQDIASEAGVSRATMYLHFKDKEQVFRHACEVLHQQALEAASDALSRDGPVSERLRDGLIAFFVTIMTPILNSAHGPELYDTSKSVGADIFTARRLDLVLLIENLISTAGAVTLKKGQAKEIAETLVSAAEGIKASAPDLIVLRARLGLLTSLIA